VVFGVLEFIYWISGPSKTAQTQTYEIIVRGSVEGLIKGSAVQFKTQKEVVNGRAYDVVADAILSMLGVRLIQELAGQVKKISEVSKAEEKNSAGA